MEVRHNTPLAASLDSALDRDGNEVRVATMKATFDFADGKVRLADEQESIVLADVYFGAPGKSSVMYESDGALYKPGTDVVFMGSVFAPNGRPQRHVLVSVSVGSITHEVLVMGDRRWHWGPLSIQATDAEPFDAIPLRWERSFGGVDLTHPDPAYHAADDRNPIGTGFRVTKTRESIDGLPLPNFEDPRTPVKQWDDKPPPQGLGFVNRSWQERRRLAGTYDDGWTRNRAPLLPTDFDYRYFNSAPQPLALRGHLKGGETLVMKNLTRHDVETFQIPKIRVTFSGFAEGRPFRSAALLDTVVVQTERQQVVMVWRLKFRVALDETADVVRGHVEYFA